MGMGSVFNAGKCIRPMRAGQEKSIAACFEYPFGYNGFMPFDFDKLRKKRLRKNLTQQGIARILGWKQPMYARFESGQRGGKPIDPSLSQIEAICRVIGCKIKELITSEK